VNASGSVFARYTQGSSTDEPLAESNAGATNYYEADGLGSITSLTSSTGVLAGTYTYDSFGKLTTSSSTLTNPFRYTAREFDSETGLYFCRARFYDPTTGRFIREDPVKFMGGVNFYSYAYNNPSNLKDPLGLWTIQIGINVGYTVPFGLTGSGFVGIAFDGSGNIGTYSGGARAGRGGRSFGWR
jgi:RHS repeat-associated protein